MRPSCLLPAGDDRSRYSGDIFNEGAEVAGVAAPRNVDDVLALVAYCRANGLHLLPRGGGMSYTGGYVSHDPAHAVVIDLGQLDQVIEINAVDLYVVVQPGVTWKALDAALEPHGLRAAYWGPISGAKATVGGSVAQNAIFWGAGNAGSAADTVLGVEVVTGGGEVIRTGSLGMKSSNAFFRHFGPDLSGLFTSDAGALGIKTRIALQLTRRPAETQSLSFALPSGAALCEFLSSVARDGIAAQQVGFDVALKAERMAGGLRDGIAELLRIIRAAPSILSGVTAAARVALAGRHILDDCPYSAHVFLEAASTAGLAEKRAEVRRIAATLDAREVESSVGRVMSATPFAPLNGITGSKGERWAPVHCLVPHSRAEAALAAIDAVFADEQPTMAQHGIRTSLLFNTVGRNGFVIEPMFFWRDALSPLHRDTLGEARLARLQVFPRDDEARAAVARLRYRIIDAVDALGSVHIQVGRTYRLLGRIDPGAATLLHNVRSMLDPDGVMNPGVLDAG